MQTETSAVQTETSAAITFNQIFVAEHQLEDGAEKMDLVFNDPIFLMKIRQIYQLEEKALAAENLAAAAKENYKALHLTQSLWENAKKEDRPDIGTLRKKYYLAHQIAKLHYNIATEFWNKLYDEEDYQNYINSEMQSCDQSSDSYFYSDIISFKTEQGKEDIFSPLDWACHHLVQAKKIYEDSRLDPIIQSEHFQAIESACAVFDPYSMNARKLHINFNLHEYADECLHIKKEEESTESLIDFIEKNKPKKQDQSHKTFAQIQKRLKRQQTEDRTTSEGSDQEAIQEKGKKRKRKRKFSENILDDEADTLHLLCYDDQTNHRYVLSPKSDEDVDAFDTWHRAIYDMYCKSSKREWVLHYHRILNGMHAIIKKDGSTMIVRAEKIDDDQAPSLSANLPKAELAAHQHLLPSLDRDGEEKTRQKKKKKAKNKSKTSHPQYQVKNPSAKELRQLISSPSAAPPEFLRKEQQEDFLAVLRAMDEGHRRIAVAKPTGTGKTAEMAALINLYRQIQHPILILVPTVVLAEQTKEKLIQYSAHLENIDPEDIGVFAPSKGMRELKPITVMTNASYSANSRKNGTLCPHDEVKAALAQNINQLFKKYEYFFNNAAPLTIFVDEAHHLQAQGLQRMLRTKADEAMGASVAEAGGTSAAEAGGASARSTDTSSCSQEEEYERLIFAFSASIGERNSGTDYQQALESFHFAVEQTLMEGIHTKVLSEMQITKLDFSMYKEAQALTRKLKQITQGAEINEEGKQLIRQAYEAKMGFNLTALSTLLQIMKKQGESTKKTLIFTETIEHAEILKAMLDNMGAQSYTYHSKRKDRETVLEWFKKNKGQPILIAIGALDEGFDDPDVNVILDFTIYKEKIRRVIQRLGRGLRRDEEGTCLHYIWVKLLTQDMQMNVAERVLGTTSGRIRRSAGYEEDGTASCKPHTAEGLTLSAAMTVPKEVVDQIEDGTLKTKLIRNPLLKPSPAKLQCAGDPKPSKLGDPPEAEEEITIDETGTGLAAAGAGLPIEPFSFSTSLFTPPQLRPGSQPPPLDNPWQEEAYDMNMTT